MSLFYPLKPNLSSHRKIFPPSCFIIIVIIIVTIIDLIDGLLVHFPNAQSGWDWPEPDAEGQKSNPGLPLGWQEPSSLGHPMTSLDAHHQGSRAGSKHSTGYFTPAHNAHITHPFFPLNSFSLLFPGGWTRSQTQGRKEGSNTLLCHHLENLGFPPQPLNPNSVTKQPP